MKYLSIMVLTLIVMKSFAAPTANCKLINFQCADNSPTKTINGITYNLSDACAANNLTGNDCCWSATSKYYCQDSNDTCSPYRQNPNCKFVSNTCQTTNPLTNGCLTAQTTFSCASAYQPVESQICTKAICVNNNNNNESDLANNCFMPVDIANQRAAATKSNVNDLASILSFLEIGKQASGDLQNCSGGDPLNCTIFRGDYYTCDIYNPDSPWNGGSDCMIHKQYFTDNMAGQNLSNKAMYGSVAGNQGGAGFNSNGNNYTVGDRYNYGLSNQDMQTMNSINRDIQSMQGNGANVYNSDTGAIANPKGTSQYMKLNNSQISNLNISDYAANNLGTWSDHLTENSAKLAWNRIKADPNPFNAKQLKLSELGVTRPGPGNIDSWGDDKPVYVQGLCIYLSNYNDGGTQDGTDSVVGKAVCLGNAQCGAVCTIKEPISGLCLAASAKPTREEWCCFNSKLAMDINIAAYDQNLTTFYKSGSKFISGGNVIKSNNKCAGLTIKQLSQIDFSKGEYFKDFQNTITVQNLNNVVNMNSVTGTAQGAINSRVKTSMKTQIDQTGIK